MQLTEDILKKWEDIVDQVDKEHIPIECVKKIVFRFDGGRQKTINIQKLKKQSIDVEDIHNIVDRYVQDHCDEITNMEFVLDIEEVAKLLQPETDNLLKNL